MSLVHDTADIPGLTLVSEAILPELERRVLNFAAEPTRAWEHPVLRQGLLPARRAMISYGSRYVTSGRSLGSAGPLPPVLEECRVRVADLAGIDGDHFTQAILTHYPPKAGIGWHSDAPVFGEPVVTLSLVGGKTRPTLALLGGAGHPAHDLMTHDQLARLGRSHGNRPPDAAA